MMKEIQWLRPALVLSASALVSTGVVGCQPSSERTVRRDTSVGEQLPVSTLTVKATDTGAIVRAPQQDSAAPRARSDPQRIAPIRAESVRPALRRAQVTPPRPASVVTDVVLPVGASDSVVIPKHDPTRRNILGLSLPPHDPAVENCLELKATIGDSVATRWIRIPPHDPMKQASVVLDTVPCKP